MIIDEALPIETQDRLNRAPESRVAIRYCLKMVRRNDVVLYLRRIAEPPAILFDSV